MGNSNEKQIKVQYFQSQFDASYGSTFLLLHHLILDHASTFNTSYTQFSHSNNTNKFLCMIQMSVQTHCEKTLGKCKHKAMSNLIDRINASTHLFRYGAIVWAKAIACDLSLIAFKLWLLSLFHSPIFFSLPLSLCLSL